ncbi:MAG TPA: MlaD family protein [Solirubrobacteraceae bacterium]|nr:MlaD family protein [Solirubrobacteraceae bacterium]
MKRILISGVLLAAAAVFVVLATGASQQSAAGTYKIEFDNAFGLVTGANFEVSGVPAGTIQSIGLDPKNLHAVVTVNVTKPGFGQFHSDANCESRPESLIGEYYVDCNPGSAGQVLKPGSTIPVTNTRSTIPADLLQNIMRLPYRERMTILINELGAGVAARGGDLQAALHRAVPALTETDALLNVLSNDSTTLQNLTRDSNQVITALANNSANVKRFIDEANRTAVATASQQQNLRGTLARMPGLLEQLRPAMAQLRTTMITNQPVLVNLHQASGEINRLFTDLPAFSRSARPAIKSLGQASVTGKVAVTAARPTVKDLNAFAKPTPELAGNLAIVGHDLDTQSRAVEPDPRSPGGKGFSGLQALLWYAFNQTLAVNTYGPLGHMLAVDAFFSPMCSPYATPASIALMLKQYGPAYRQCYSWLGPNQPGVNEPDPSNPNAPVPDPGGAPPGKPGPSTSATRLTAAEVQAAQASARTARTARSAQSTSSSSSSSSTTTSASTTTPAATPPVPGAPPINLKQSVGQILAGTVGSGSGASVPAGSSSQSATSGSSSGSGTAGQAQQLLNYLLAP